VDPIKPTLEAPGSKHLKLEHEKLLSIFALKFNLRRYIPGPDKPPDPSGASGSSPARAPLKPCPNGASVGQCKLKSVLK